MGGYSAFAYVYEELQQDVDYDKWVNQFLELAAKKRVREGKALDLACGAGRASFFLAQKGFRVTGIDLSEEMIGLAREKAEKSGTGIEFLVGDISNFELENTFDLVTGFNAGINYLSSLEQVTGLVKSVKKVLKQEGVFAFDIMGKGYCFAPEKASNFRSVSGGYIGTETARQDDLITMSHSIFIQENNAYRLYTDEEKLRIYHPGVLKEIFRENGLPIVKVVSRSPMRADIVAIHDAGGRRPWFGL